jgi:hypothetical protein
MSTSASRLERRQLQMARYTAYAEAAIKASWRFFNCEKEIDKDARAEYERTSYDALRVRRFALKQDLAPKQAAHDAAVAEMLNLHRLCDAMLGRAKAAEAVEAAEAVAAAASLTAAVARAESTHAVAAAAAAELKSIDGAKADVDAELQRMTAAMAKASTDAFTAAAGVMARLGKRKLELEAEMEKMKR